MNRSIHPCLGLATLLLVSGLSITAAADDAPPTLAAAQALQLQHRPKEAIAQFTALIERNRYDVETSAPALAGLVACFQLLKSDAQAEKEYQTLAAKYLTTPPPLDGTAALDPDRAREDLLWKRWAEPSPADFKIVNAQRTRTLRDGKRESNLTLSLSAEKLKGLPLVAATDDGSGEVIGISPEGTSYTGTARVDRHGRFSLESGDEVILSLTFTDVPASMKTFTSLSGGCPINAAKRVTRQVIPLQNGATWKIGAGTVGTLVAIRDQGAEYGLQIAIAAADRKEAADADEDSVTLSGSAFSSAGSGSGPGMGSDGPRFWLKGASGEAMHVGGISSTSVNGNSSLSCQIPKTEAAQCLVWETVAEVSTHVVAFSLKDVAIP